MADSMADMLQRIEAQGLDNAKTLKRIEDKIDNHNKILERIENNIEKLYNDIIGILKIIHGIMVEILSNLTAEQGGDLVAALRKLTEAVNSLGSTVAANPSVIVSQIKKEINLNGSNS